MKKEIFVYGHRNPDTDSICSAISMAYLKNQIDPNNTYVPRAAGEPNQETTYVLERFGVAKPKVVKDIRRQVGDANIKRPVFVDKDESILDVYRKLTDNDVKLVVVKDGDTTLGIVTLGDVAKNYIAYIRGYDGNVAIEITAKDVMTAKADLVSINMDDYLDDIKEYLDSKRFREYPVLKDGEIVAVASKDIFLLSKGKTIVLVDHNEQAQAVFGTHQAKVVEILDHHKLGTMPTLEPIKVTTRPVGCSSTIVYGMYKEFGVVPPKEIAGMMCSAITSDTMLFKSPTCTPIDEAYAREIAEIAEVDLKDLWDGMLKASLNLEGKSDKDIFYQDYKQFKGGSASFGAGQVMVANAEDLQSLKKRMLPYLSEALKSEGLDFVALMITDVSENSSELIYTGENAKEIIEAAFGVKEVSGGVYLEGAVSRKKQLIPPIMAVIG